MTGFWEGVECEVDQECAGLTISRHGMASPAACLLRARGHARQGVKGSVEK